MAVAFSHRISLLRIEYSSILAGNTTHTVPYGKVTVEHKYSKDKGGAYQRLIRTSPHSTWDVFADILEEDVIFGDEIYTRTLL